MLKKTSWLIVTPVIILLLVLLSGCGTVTPPADTASDSVTAIVHVNVIPMDRERVLSDQTVVVREGRISRISAASRTKVPAGSTVIDGAGKYLIPALADMHVHMKGEAGTIEEGKRADLVLLEANPLEEITNSRKIAGVMVQGRWLPKAELQDGLEEIASLWEALSE